MSELLRKLFLKKALKVRKIERELLRISKYPEPKRQDGEDGLDYQRRFLRYQVDKDRAVFTLSPLDIREKDLNKVMRNSNKSCSNFLEFILMDLSPYKNLIDELNQHYEKGYEHD